MKRNIRSSALAIQLLFLLFSAYSQDQTALSLKELPRNSLYIGVLSVNYSRLFPGDQIGVTVAGGISFVTTLDEGAIGFMIESTLLKGGTKHFFEPGILLYADPSIFAPMLRLGYRYLGAEGFLFRIAPLFTYMDGFTLLPAVSIGYSF